MQAKDVFIKCSSFQISHLIVTVEFAPFGTYRQLDHPVICGNIKCYSHNQIITWIKSYIWITCFPELCSRNSKWYWKERKKVLETFYVKKNFVTNVNCDVNQNICEAIITITFPCKKTTMKHDMNKLISPSLNVESKI